VSGEAITYARALLYRRTSLSLLCNLLKMKNECALRETRFYWRGRPQDDAHLVACRFIAAPRAGGARHTRGGDQIMDRRNMTRISPTFPPAPTM